jgi:Holliday junction DNA helicase RuvA
MIAAIQGTIIASEKSYLIVFANAIGYKIYVNNNVLSNYKKNDEIKLFTHLAVKETALDLYGFEQFEELEFFELLLKVSGIGPKGALAVLEQAKIEELKVAIASSDYSILTKVSGIGKKTAEKIIIELRNKIGDLSEYTAASQTSGALGSDLEAIEALTALGYNQMEARQALKKINPEIKELNDKIKEALKLLGR